jgi:predicted small secreted protein
LRLVLFWYYVFDLATTELEKPSSQVRHRTDCRSVEEDRECGGVSANDYEEMDMAKKLLAVLAALAVMGPLSAISGCNTVAGAGKDIERGGEKIQGEAKEVQRKM